MTLKGLPESPLPPGSVVLTSLLSVLVSTAGLALLRSTRPSKVQLISRTTTHYGGFPPCFFYNILGIFGALLLFLGQVFSSFPMLMGVSTDDEGKAAAIVQCSQVLLCWAVERYRIAGHSLPMMQSFTCAIVWFGSTLVEWAGPRPYDNISLGLRSQVSGCDGGYRSPFLVYAAGWLTCITFGVLFLCVDEDTGPSQAQRAALDDVQRDAEPAPAPAPRVASCRGLPGIYGVAVSMSGMVFAQGTSTNDMRWVCFGALLLVVAVVCAWEWLWCVEHTLGTWAPISQCFATLAKLGQAHLVFRDFRWDPESVYGALVMWRWPGIPLFLCGFVLLMCVVQVYNNTCTWKDWGRGAPRETSNEEQWAKGRRSEPSRRPMSRSASCLYVLQWMLLPFCITCCLIGVSSTLVETNILLPEVRWLADEAAIEKYENSTRPGTGHVIRSGRSYLDLISSLYAGRLPCSALVVAYNSVVMPPLQFLGFIIVLLGKGRLLKVSEDTMEAIKHYTLHQAPRRFTNPMILMTGVGVIQLTAPSGKMEAGFTRGYWYFIAYVCSCLLLAWSLSFDVDGQSQEPEASSAGGSRGSRCSSRRLDLPGNSVADMKVQLSKSSRVHSEDTYDEEDVSDLDSEAESAQGLHTALWSRGWDVLAISGLLPTIAVTMYLGLTRPFLNFDYRMSGISVQKSEPSLLEIWRSLGEKSRFLKCFSATTLIVTLVLWVMLLGLTVLAKSRQRPGSKPRIVSRLVSGLELVVRPWVLGDVWAFCLVLVYYIVRARNKAVFEVCAHFPANPIGMAAIVLMGGSIAGLLHFGKALVDPPHPKRRGTSLNLPGPGGTMLWAGGAAIVGSFWLFILYTHGPTLDPEIANLEDVNTVLSKMLPVTNTHLHDQLPESSGDCQALWEHRIIGGKALYASPPSEVHRRCRGEAPLVRQSRKRGRTTMEVEAKWATGLNTLEIMDVLILPPANITAFTQEWNMTIRAKFSDLHVWLKVLLGDKEWVDDYMCCDSAFHFTVQASARCTLGYGFHPIQLHVLHMDPINFRHRVEVERTPDYSASWNIDYGRSDDVEDTLRKFLTGKRGKLLFKNSDGSTTDPLASASNVLNKIVSLNIGQQCLYKW